MAFYKFHRLKDFKKENGLSFNQMESICLDFLKKDFDKVKKRRSKITFEMPNNFNLLQFYVSGGMLTPWSGGAEGTLRIIEKPDSIQVDFYLVNPMIKYFVNVIFVMFFFGLIINGIGSISDNLTDSVLSITENIVITLFFYLSSHFYFNGQFKWSSKNLFDDLILKIRKTKANNG